MVRENYLRYFVCGNHSSCMSLFLVEITFHVWRRDAPLDELSFLSYYLKSDISLILRLDIAIEKTSLSEKGIIDTSILYCIDTKLCHFQIETEYHCLYLNKINIYWLAKARYYETRNKRNVIASLTWSRLMHRIIMPWLSWETTPISMKYSLLILLWAWLFSYGSFH